MFHAGKAYARGSVLGLTYSAASAVAFNMVTGFISSGPAHDVKLALTAGARHLVIYEWVVFILGWQ